MSIRDFWQERPYGRRVKTLSSSHVPHRLGRLKLYKEGIQAIQLLEQAAAAPDPRICPQLLH